MKQSSIKVVILALAVALVLGMSSTALAYNTVSYKDASGNMQSCLFYDEFDASMWELGDETGNDNWYVVSQNTTITHQLTIYGDVRLILCDGATLTIDAPSGCAIYGDSPGGHACSLTIYGQSSGTGALVAYGATEAISVRNDVTINGGSVTANGYYDGIFTIFGNVTINGGKVTAKGEKKGIRADAEVIITSGEVSATGTGTDSFGIDCKKLTISGGTVTANAKNVALGGGAKTTISGGKVTATSDSAALSTMDLTISGSAVVNATGGTGGMAAGSSPSKATITGGTVTAAGGTSGIGDGIAYNDITISGGTVTANGPSGIRGETVTISGGTVKAKGDKGIGIVAYTVSINNGTKSVTADGTENAVVGFTSISIGDELMIREPTGGEVGDAVVESLNAKTILDGSAAATHALIVPGEETAYAFTKGDGAEWQKGSTEGLDFTVKGSPDDTDTFKNFDFILMDGTAVAAGNYTAAAGSVKLTLKADYLENLAAGGHTLRAAFRDGGSAEAKFTVKAAGTTPTNTDTSTPTLRPVPKTGDSSHPVLWYGMIILGAAGLATLAALKASRKRK